MPSIDIKVQYGFLGSFWFLARFRYSGYSEHLGTLPAGICLLKVNNKNTKTRYEICSKLTIKIREQHQWHHSGIFIVNFEHISHLVLVLLLLSLNM